MNTTLAEATVLATTIRNGLHNVSGVEVVLCPPYPWLVPVAGILHHRPLNLQLGAQDVYPLEEGAVTGAVSAPMLKGIISYVITGHSERRRLFGETDALINEKLHAILRTGMRPILAVGEWKKIHHLTKLHHGRPTKLEERSNVVAQLRAALAGVAKAQAPKLVIAYEPVWAIGTGDAADGAYANHIASILRKELERQFGALGLEIPILYGGSVSADNAEQFALQPEIDGVLVGGGSLKTKEFLAICRTFSQ